VNELTLVPEVEARRALREHRLRLSVLAPYGAWIGCGTLRVLRIKVNDDDSTVLTAGYESYRRLTTSASHQRPQRRS
jgi:hypothetical protein